MGVEEGAVVGEGIVVLVTVVKGGTGEVGVKEDIVSFPNFPLYSVFRLKTMFGCLFFVSKSDHSEVFRTSVVRFLSAFLVLFTPFPNLFESRLLILLSANPKFLSVNFGNLK